MVVDVGWWPFGGGGAEEKRWCPFFNFDPHTQRSSLPSQSCPSRWCPQVVVVGRSLAAVVDVGGGRSVVVVASRENPIPNLILFSFSFSTPSHFPSLSLMFVAVVTRGGGRRSFFGGGGRRWYRVGGGRADASFARAAPVPSHFQVSFVPFLCFLQS